MTSAQGYQACCKPEGPKPSWAASPGKPVLYPESQLYVPPIPCSILVESEWTPGVGDGQGGLVCCDSWGRKESNTTERLNWTELKAQNELQWPRPKVLAKADDDTQFSYLRARGIASWCTNLSAAERLGNVRTEEKGSDISQLSWPCEWLWEEPLVSEGPLALQQHGLDTGRDTVLPDDHVSLVACWAPRLCGRPTAGGVRRPSLLWQPDFSRSAGGQ